MAIEQDSIPSYIVIVMVWVGMLMCCTLAITYFYGLHGTATLYPYKSQFEQYVAIARTALIATLAFFMGDLVWCKKRAQGSNYRAKNRIGKPVHTDDLRDSRMRRGPWR